MLTKQLREMERQAQVIENFQKDFVEISESYWNKIKKEYRKWYKDYFGHKRKPIVNSNDFLQVCSFIKANNWIIPFSTNGVLRINFKDGTYQDIYYSIHK
jgi:hypothetical protein